MMNIREFLVKLQNLTDQQKKTIIIAIVLILAFIFGFLWLRLSIDRLNKLGNVASDINLPEINLPETQIPENLNIQNNK